MQKKIKASYHSGKGYARHTMHSPAKQVQNKIYTCFDNITDVEEAEKKLYGNMFSEELELHNQKSRKKGNYGRIMTMDEWMKTERHRPIENMLQIGNMDCFTNPSDLWECYMKFANWRYHNFRDNLILISAVMQINGLTTPHILERYVLYWKDGQGIAHSGINKSLLQAGVGLPNPNQPEGRYNFRKMAFDAMCREKWLDIVEEMLQKYRGLELDRAVDQKNKKYRAGHPGTDSWRAYNAALSRTSKTLSMLRKREDDLCDREQAVQNEKEALKLQDESLRIAAGQQNADIADIAKKLENNEKLAMELKEREHIYKQRLKDTYKRRLDAEKKLEKILNELNQYYAQPSYRLGGNN